MKNTQKGFIVPLVIAIIVILAAGGAYVAVKHKETAKVDSVQLVASTTSENNSPSEKVIPEVVQKTVTENVKNTVIKNSVTIPIPLATKASLKVISPNGGENLVMGKDYKITWTDEHDVSNVAVYVVSSEHGGIGSNILGNISVRASGIDDIHSYIWKVGVVYPLADSLDGMGIGQEPINPGKYKLNICNRDTKKCDISDNYFTVSIDSTLTPAITLLSPKVGETVKIGQSFLINWKTNRVLLPGYKFVINAGSGDRPLDAYQPDTSYAYYYLIDRYRVTGDLLSDVTPGHYKIKISLYDGKIPLYEGKTCPELVRTGNRMWCNAPDLYGALVTESSSDNFINITN